MKQLASKEKLLANKESKIKSNTDNETFAHNQGHTKDA